MSERLQHPPTATEPPTTTEPPATAAPSAGHPAPPVFSAAAFALVLVGVFGATLVAPLTVALASDRFALPGPLATGLAAVAAAAFAAALGGAAALVSRRLAFYEVAAATLLWAALVAVVAVSPALRGARPLQPLESQGTLVVVLGLLGAGLLAAIAVFAGSTAAYLATGTGRFDPSVSYELFVARSHLRLEARTIAALFAMVVTGLVPGLLVALGWSLVRDAKERRAYRRGELFQRARMPATLLMTLISIGGVAIGVWALTVVLSVMSGFEADLKHKILGHNAHGMVLTYGQDAFDDWRRAREKVLGVQGVTGATPFLYNEVMLSAGQNLTGSILKGIDIDTVGTVTDLPLNIEDGAARLAPHAGEDPALRPRPGGPRRPRPRGRPRAAGPPGSDPARHRRRPRAGALAARVRRRPGERRLAVRRPRPERAAAEEPPLPRRRRSSTAGCTSTTRSSRTSISARRSGSSGRARPSPGSSSRSPTSTTRAR